MDADAAGRLGNGSGDAEPADATGGERVSLKVGSENERRDQASRDARPTEVARTETEHPGGVLSSVQNAVVGGNMFADSEAMRAKMHENIDKKDYDVADYYYETGVVQAIAKSSKFGTLTLTVIGLNAFWIGLDTECNNRNDMGRYVPGCPFQASDKDFWFAGEQAFCTFFTLELLIRFGAFASKWSALRDNWFKFDSVLVLFMAMETWIIPFLVTDNGNGGLEDFALLRMLRLLRLTRMVRLMRSVPELVTLLKGMVIASRSVCYTLLLLVLILYIFSIIFKSQLVDTKVPGLKDHFSNILRSMWTLLITGCLLDDIAKIGDLLVQHNIIMAVIFMMFVLLSSLMVLNMLIGVLCAVVTAVAAAEKEKALVNFVKSKLITVLHQLDDDGNGTISKGEFDQLVHIPEAVNALNELGVDVPNLLSLADFLFEVDEDDGKASEAALRGGESSSSLRRGNQPPEASEEGASEEDEGKSMTFAEFLEMVIRLRSENQPSVADIVELRKLLFKGQRQVQRRIDRIEKGQADLQRMVQVVHAQLDAALELSEEFAFAGDLPPELQALISGPQCQSRGEEGVKSLKLTKGLSHKGGMMDSCGERAHEQSEVAEINRFPCHLAVEAGGGGGARGGGREPQGQG